jgi:hypothetical protein
MPRRSTSVVYLCLVVVVLAAFLPGASALDYAIPTPQWVLLPDLSIVTHDLDPTAGVEQPVSLRWLVSSRAPPLS